MKTLVNVIKCYVILTLKRNVIWPNWPLSFIETLMHLFSPKKFCITIFFDFSSDDCNTREEFENLFFEGERGVNKFHYGLSENGELTYSYPFFIGSNQNHCQLFCLSYLVVCFCFVIGHGWCFEAQWRFAVGRLPSSPVSQAAYPHTHPWYRGSRRSLHAGRGGGWGRRGGRCCGLSLRNDVTAKYGRGCCCSAKLG